MKNLRFVYFNPFAEVVTLSLRDSNSFNSSVDIPISSLTETQQSVVAAALAWLGGKLTGGEVVRKVILEPILDDPSHPKLNATVTGRSEAGERTISIVDAPDEVLSPLLGLWSQLEGIANA